MEWVSWKDAKQFVEKLNQPETTELYRLPGEAEWEYARRAGTNTRYSFGDDAGKLGDYAWYLANSGNMTHEVANRKPNAWGIYDMHGNVKEWVEDDFHDDYTDAPTDGRAWVDKRRGSSRPMRGGA